VVRALSMAPSRVRANKAVCAEQVRGKAMADKADGLLDLFHDVLLTARLDDKARFRQVRHITVVIQSRAACLLCFHSFNLVPAC
jgi:hypothetical protein